MSTINTAVTGATGSTPFSTLEEKKLNAGQFLDLMIQELQMQDPMQPLSNHEMVAQFTQIYQMQSAQGLQEAITSMAQFTQFSSASNLIGCYVIGKDEGAQPLEGIVESVFMNDGKISLMVNGKKMPLKGVREVIGLVYTPEGQAAADAAANNDASGSTSLDDVLAAINQALGGLNGGSSDETSGGEG